MSFMETFVKKPSTIKETLISNSLVSLQINSTLYFSLHYSLSLFLFYKGKHLHTELISIKLLGTTYGPHVWANQRHHYLIPLRGSLDYSRTNNTYWITPMGKCTTLCIKLKGGVIILAYLWDTQMYLLKEPLLKFLLFNPLWAHTLNLLHSQQLYPLESDTRYRYFLFLNILPNILKYW